MDLKRLSIGYKVLGGEPYIISDEKKYDLGSKIIDIYSKKVFSHPRLADAIKVNRISDKDFLSGAEEAEAFTNGKYVKLHQSTLRKVDVFHNIIDLILQHQLKTKAKWYDVYGITPYGIRQAISENLFASIVYSLFMALLGGLLVYWIF